MSANLPSEFVEKLDRLCKEFEDFLWHSCHSSRPPKCRFRFNWLRGHWHKHVEFDFTLRFYRSLSQKFIQAWHFVTFRTFNHKLPEWWDSVLHSAVPPAKFVVQVATLHSWVWNLQIGPKNWLVCLHFVSLWSTEGAQAKADRSWGPEI